MIHRKTLLLSALAASTMLLPLTGCDMYRPSVVTNKSVEVHETNQVFQYPAESFGQADAADIIAHYDRHGNGLVSLTVTYDPTSQTNTAMNATKQASHIAGMLRDAGLTNYKADILPVRGKGDSGKLLVSYNSYDAKAPDCKVMSQYDSNDVEPDKDYEMGCTLETIYAKQIANPKDLAGQDGKDMGPSNGQSSSNIVGIDHLGNVKKSLGGVTSTGSK